MTPTDQYADQVTIQMTATEVKAKILGLLDQLADGEDIEITKHGRVVARLVSAGSPQSLRDSFAGIATSQASDEELFSTGVQWDLD